MAQNFDPEVYKKLVAVTEDLESGAISRLPGAMSQVTELAAKSGAPALIKSATAAAEEGVPAFSKVFKELLDCLREYTNKSKSVLNALGHDV